MAVVLTPRNFIQAWSQLVVVHALRSYRCPVLLVLPQSQGEGGLEIQKRLAPLMHRPGVKVEAAARTNQSAAKVSWLSCFHLQPMVMPDPWKKNGPSISYNLHQHAVSPYLSFVFLVSASHQNPTVLSDFGPDADRPNTRMTAPSKGSKPYKGLWT